MTEIVRVGCKLYIITYTPHRACVTIVGKGSKVEEIKEYKSILDIPPEIRLRVNLARIFERRKFRRL